jgi:hypothetical protein
MPADGSKGSVDRNLLMSRFQNARKDHNVEAANRYFENLAQFEYV